MDLIDFVLDLLNNIYVQIAIGILIVLLILGIVLLYVYYIEYKKSTGGKPLTWKYLFALALFIGGLPIILSSLSIFWIYCKIISVILRIKYGSKFAGLLDGTDAIHVIDREDPSANCGNILFIVQRPSGNNNSPSNSGSFSTTVREEIIRRFKDPIMKTPKLWYTWHHFTGFAYFLGNDVTPEECVRVMEHKYCEDGESIGREEFLRHISKHYSNQRLPKDHTALWELLIGTHPIKWKADSKNDSALYYPVLFRIHHGLSDATGLLKGIIRLFGDVDPKDMNNSKNEKTDNATSKKYNFLTKIIKSLWNKIIRIVYSIYMFLMVPPILLIQGLIKCNDNHCLHGPILSGEKYLVCGVEDSPHYVQAVKKIKSRMPGTAFSDILLTALSASLNDFIEKYKKPLPDSLSHMVPVLPEAQGLSKFIPVKHSLKKYICKNDFSMAMLHLPTRVKSETNTASEAILDRLEIVKKESAVFRRSIDFQINFFILKAFVGILPLKIRRPLSILLHTTSMISILPAPPLCTLMGGYAVKDAVFWVPNRGPIALGFSILSYDNRFQIGMIADKAIIPEEKDVQDIVDGIYNYLDILNLESDYSKV